MKRLALGLALLSAMAAHAQKVYRCVDSRGATYYTEKPGPGCKPTWIESRPGEAPGAAPSEKAAAAAAAKTGKTARGETPAPMANVKRSFTPAPSAKAHCEGLSTEAVRLRSGQSSLAESAGDMRLAGIEKELERSCR